MNKIEILKATDEYAGHERDEKGRPWVHGLGVSGGDASTLCGVIFVDDCNENLGGSYKYTKKHITCYQCISELDYRVQYVKRNGKWY